MRGKTRARTCISAGAIFALLAGVLWAAPALASPTALENDTLESRVAELTAILETPGSLNEWHLKENLSCVPVWEHKTYCPLWAWADGYPSVESRMVVLESDEKVRGDMPWAVRIHEIEQLPIAEQALLLREDLREAISVTGKVLADEALIGRPAPDPETLASLPGAIEYLDGAEPVDALSKATWLASGSTNGTVSGKRTDPFPSVVMHKSLLVSSTAATKQETSYWCGPAAMAFMARHDPVVGSTISKSQSQWASWLGTTASYGTSIWSMKDQTNLRLTGWKNRVNSYAVFSISSWSVPTWQNRFITTVENKKAPIILNPKLTNANSTYIPVGWNTGGHFNVGAGYYGYSTGMAAWIFEPYVGNPSNPIPKLVREWMENVRQQNLDNSAHRNIAY